MVCIERGSKLTYDIHNSIRLVEASEYNIDTFDSLKGFISGLYAGNYDISQIFIDSLCKIVPSDITPEVEKFLDWLENFSEKHGIKFVVTISADRLCHGRHQQVLLSGTPLFLLQNPDSVHLSRVFAKACSRGTPPGKTRLQKEIPWKSKASTTSG